MQTATLIVVFGLTAVVASPVGDLKIVGGQVAVINQYPSAVALLRSWNGVDFSQSCAGTILTTRSVLTACHCVYGDIAARWRVRAGSAMANSGGSVYALSSLMYHPSFSIVTMDSDVAILRTSSPIVYGNLAQPAVISGSSYTLADNQVVRAVGWGTTAAGDAASNQLRHVQIWTVNQNNCASRYRSIGVTITANMLCAGWLDVGGRDQCSGDSGGPLYHNGVLVGVCSFGYGCASAVYPGVNARVSKLASWIQSNAKS